jgi:acyl-CoA thioesterase FadM
MTTHLNVRYRSSVPVGKGPLEIRARLKEMKRNFAFIDAEISHDGKVCTSCEMIYCTFSKEVAEKDFMFFGCPLEDE